MTSQPLNTSAPSAPEEGPESLSVAQLLLRAARDHAHSGVRYLVGPTASESVRQSYPELLESALGLLSALRGRGLRPRDTVALLLDRQPEFLTVLWACLLGGFVPCPMVPIPGDPARWSAQLAHVNGLLDGPLLVTTEAMRAELPEVPGLAVAVVEELRDEAADPSRAERGRTPAVHSAASEDLALLVLTSGSTGNSKAVTLTHGNILASMAGKAGKQQLTAADTTFNWISYDHVAALLEAHMLPLYVGAEQLHAEAAVILEEPLRFLRIISRHKVTMTFTPNFLLGPLNSSVHEIAEEISAGGEGLDLSALRHIVSGGEANVVATGEAFLAHYAPYGLREGALWPAFGMTETCAGSIYNRAFPVTDVGQEFANLGTPVEGLRIRVADDDHRALPAGEIGELQLSGPMITSGYYHDEAATEAAFTPDGWFRSGDLGRIDEGRLTLVGRSKDSVIVNGVNYFSHEIEAALEQLDDVASGFVAAFPTRRPGSDTEQLVIAVSPEPADDDEAGLHRMITAVRSTVVIHWGFRPFLILPLPKDAFPKTSLGKTLRRRMRHRLESGGYDEVIERFAELTTRRLGGHTPPEGETERILAEIYAEMFDTVPDRISATAGFFDLGGTSLDILRLRRQVHRRLGVADLPVITVLTAPSVRQLAARLGDGGAPGAAAYDPVVPLQTGGEKTPLFCVHPGVGEVLVFVNLAKYFVGDRPFYALRARGFNEHEKPFTSFEEMVECYVEAIRARQPHGPYAVAGYSYGGAVAFEIAKALEAQGERVDFVGSFNLPPHIKYRMEELDFVETATNLAFFLDLINKKQSLDLPAELRPLPREEQLAHLLRIAPRGRLDELDLDLDTFTAWAELAHGLTTLGRDYHPSGTTRSMTVFYAIPLRGTKEDWLENELRRWDEHTTEPNRYLDVPGEHYTLMGPRHVAAFQAVLRRELDRALCDADRARTAGQA
ncbi:non-ribosomal peptide synthetase [Streptomyces antimycoticus]|uniref:non-ribosomal peptide synthetase n=1 Tax=Streptomyces antimycoticus TaxID=68175 RepID=UPI002570E4B2|nr:non-ribosomal peptide synthetase [Streptomyces antimycoticus]WJD97275.1 non-ribosomal peptide synthetase [Streptomyces antimycoticus]